VKLTTTQAGVVGGVAVARVVVIVEVLPTADLPHPLKILGISQPWVPSEVSQTLLTYPCHIFIFGFSFELMQEKN